MPKSRVRKKKSTAAAPANNLTPVKVSGGPSSTLYVSVMLGLMVFGLLWLIAMYLADSASWMTWMADLGAWNYLIGFGLIMFGLVLSAHKSTPLGRGRGVVVGMLGCFLVGLLWICLYYMFSGEDLYKIWVMNDLANYNLLVGIAFMAVGFTFATKWE